MKKFRIILIILLGFMLTSCTSGYNNISTDELQSKLQEDANFIDVRTSSEYTSGHIDGFVNIDYYIFKDDLSLLDNLDKTKNTYIICRSGNRSSSAATLLVDYGFTNVYNVLGGMNNWNQ